MRRRPPPGHSGAGCPVERSVLPPELDDSYWHRATLVFSDGHRRTIELEKKAEPQTFTFEVRKTSSLRLAELVQGESPGWCALGEVEVWGRDRIPVAEDLFTSAP